MSIDNLIHHVGEKLYDQSLGREALVCFGTPVIFGILEIGCRYLCGEREFQILYSPFVAAVIFPAIPHNQDYGLASGPMLRLLESGFGAMMINYLLQKSI